MARHGPRLARIKATRLAGDMINFFFVNNNVSPDEATKGCRDPGSMLGEVPRLSCRYRAAVRLQNTGAASGRGLVARSGPSFRWGDEAGRLKAFKFSFVREQVRGSVTVVLGAAWAPDLVRW